ncbi:MAG: hypothetical protein NXI31_20145 [bacterium]|nr:hypothetical protein [bacterium]
MKPIPLLILAFASALTAQSDNSRAVAEPSPSMPGGEIACNDGGRILLVDVNTGNERVLVPDNDFARPLHWLGDGSRLLYWNHDGGAWDIWCVDPVTGETNNLTRTARDNRSAADRPSSRGGSGHVAFHRGGDGVWLMNRDGTGQSRIHELGHRDLAPAWSPCGTRLAFSAFVSAGASAERRVRIESHLVEFEAATSMAVARTRPIGAGEVMFLLSANEVVLAAGFDGRSELVVHDLVSGSRRALTHSVATDSRAVLSPDGRRIVWIEGGEPRDRLRCMARDGSDVRMLAEVDGWFAPPTWSPDARFVAFEHGASRADRAVWIVGVTGDAAPRRLTASGRTFPVWRPRAATAGQSPTGR